MKKNTRFMRQIECSVVGGVWLEPPLLTICNVFVNNLLSKQ